MQTPETSDTVLQQMEMAAGAKAANLIEQYYLGAIVSTGIETVKGTGDLMRKSKAEAVASKETGQLSYIAIKSPRYSYMLNFGFEGVKSNGVAMSLNAYNHLGIAVNSGNVIDNLADEIGDLRGEQVVSRINFSTNGK